MGVLSAWVALTTTTTTSINIDPSVEAKKALKMSLGRRGIQCGLKILTAEVGIPHSASSISFDSNCWRRKEKVLGKTMTKIMTGSSYLRAKEVATKGIKPRLMGEGRKGSSS